MHDANNANKRPLRKQIRDFFHKVAGVGQAWESLAGVSGGHFLKPAPKQAMGNVEV
jgi:hypothetical protein